MLTTNPRYKYTAFKVKHLVSKKGFPYMTFVVGDRKKSSNGNFYNNGAYVCTVFKDVPEFNERMRFRFTKIISVERMTNSDFYNIVCEIEPMDIANQFDYQNNTGYSSQGQQNVGLDSSIDGMEQGMDDKTFYDSVKDDDDEIAF